MLDMMWRNRWKIIVLFFMSVVAGAYTYSFIVDKLFPSVEAEKAYTETTEVREAENKTYNFLILGVDERSDDVGRADTILLLSTNLATRRIGLISIPRDSLVSIPSNGETKINHSYAYGGVNLTAQVVKDLLGIEINNYVVFNFKSFKRAIDSMGGVDIDVEKDMYYRDDYDGEDGFIIDLKAGKQHLDSDKAIQYVRYRDEEGDIGRVRRQQKFLEALLSKVASPETLLRMPTIAREVFTGINTNISFDDFIDYVFLIRPNQKYEIKSMTLAGTPQMIDDLSYWVVDESALSFDLNRMNDFIVGDTHTETMVASNESDASSRPMTEEKIRENRQRGIFGHNENDSSIPKWEQEEDDKNDDDNEEKKPSSESVREKLLAEERMERENARIQREYAIFAQQLRMNNSVDMSGVTIINTTESASNSELAKSALEEVGITVGNIENNTSNQSPNSKTIFIVSSKDKELISKMKELSFPFSIIYKDGEEQSTLIIGSDFN